ncbi:MAG: hypothetical protein LBP54_01235 [Campylobacteraceae bacterium]|jgi:hypothetical protein|nr:hypothetical protein [Campylobacteraceae bacterium]
MKAQEPFHGWMYRENVSKAGDLVVYQNGYGKYFLETIRNKSLLEVISKIEIKEYNNKTYIFVDFIQNIFLKPTIYEYENNKINAICTYYYNVNTKCNNCKDYKLERYIVEKFLDNSFAKDRDILNIDIDNDGKKEAVKYYDNIFGGRCDYESYILTDTNEDITAYISKQYGININKCGKKIKIFAYEGKNYIHVQDSNFGLKVYLISNKSVDEYSFTIINISLLRR